VRPGGGAARAPGAARRRAGRHPRGGRPRSSPPPPPRVPHCESVRTQGVDELALAHRRPALGPDLRGTLAQVGHRPLVVGPGLATLAADLLPALRRRGVGDPRGLLLAVALVAELLVELLVLDARPCISSRHGISLRSRAHVRASASRGCPLSTTTTH